MSRSDNKKSAVALKYNPEKDYSPIVVAAGHGHAAERIISLADESGVPIYRDDSAAAVLTMLDVGQGVPPEMYSVVAAIYVEVMKLAKERQEEK
ncbi:MAG: EscU/YscU/HrcU family type III secretion system export apparatus switch protein [Oscillospiraceae bacterium]|nr:EscU/YscU/HrcU family type III secretion system export apparatus switch protein [Oscillospiraceae bacterium]MDD7278025.1 EscU/YscU/HrcU family type III secretion system export apparatus switch protein [Oscillospiraceae bacterium]MDY2863496.1 EscU/YscU/HrcU family type III secretion system export apparatus switch protein [Oscillospiraceae bacterium]